MELETLGTSSLIRKVRDFTLKTEIRPGVSKGLKCFEEQKVYIQSNPEPGGALTFPQELLVDSSVHSQVDVIVFLTALGQVAVY